MQIQFTDSRINEFSDGFFHVKNEGKPIDVSAATASDLLNRKHFIDNEWVNIFEAVGVTKKEAKKDDFAGTYPEGFPHAEKLVAGGFNFEASRLLSKEQLVEIDGIGPKAADAILAFGTEK